LEAFRHTSSLSYFCSFLRFFVFSRSLSFLFYTVPIRLSNSPKQGVKKKVKNAFCEEGNVGFNPLLHGWLALWELPELTHLFADKFVVKRSPDNGGDVAFSSVKVNFLFFLLLYSVFLPLRPRSVVNAFANKVPKRALLPRLLAASLETSSREW
jgi:hypothetical protein